MHLHDLRHTALTAYARQPGVTLKDLLDFGGHLSLSVAMKYQHASHERAEQHALGACDERRARGGGSRSQGGSRQGWREIAGRPITAMTAEDIKKIRREKAKGHTVAEIVKLTGISRASVYRALAE